MIKSTEWYDLLDQLSKQRFENIFRMKRMCMNRLIHFINTKYKIYNS